MIIAIWRNLWRLFVDKRSSSFLHVFLEILQIFLSTQTHSNTINLYKTFVFISWQKIIFARKPYFWGHFGLFLPKFRQKWISLEKRALTRYSNYLPSCQKSEKTNEPFLRKMLDWRTDRETNGDLKDPPLEGVQKTFIRDRGVVTLFVKLFITRSVLISGEGRE